MQQTRDVAAEGILLAGGARAILLQLANPAVGRGVAEHSDFADRPLDRLTGTLTYLYVVMYGTPDEVRAVARRVGHAHTPVPGARDTDLQLWVAATSMTPPCACTSWSSGRSPAPTRSACSTGSQ